MHSILLALAFVLQSPAQTPPAPPASNGEQAPAPAAEIPPAAPRPGEIPPSASARAKDLWAKLLAAASPPVSATPGSPTARAPVTAFDLTFDGRARPESGQSNDFNRARYRFLGPGFVRTSLPSGAERMRGPEGDWLVDVSKGDRVQLAGREYAQDRRELSESLNIAKSFVALTDPAQLRIAKLEDLAAPPATVPPSLAAVAPKLDWIAIESPDFHLVSASSRREAQSFRCQLGLDRATHLPELATIWEDEHGAMVHETALFVRMTKYVDLDQFHVPSQIDVYPADLDVSPFRFADVSSLSLYLRYLLKESTLRAKLAPADFSPGAK